MTPRKAHLIAWTGLVLALACGVAELLAGLGYRWGWWHYRTGLSIMRWAATTDIAAVLLALVALALAWKSRGRRAGLRAVQALVLALIVGGPPLYLYSVVSTVPRIHDVSTDTDNPPRFVAVLSLRKSGDNPTTYTAEVAAEQKKGYPEIRPARFDAAPAAVLQRAERVARAMGWEVAAVVPAEGRLEATDTSLLFGFKDDVVIRVSADGTGSRVDVRSISRVGRSDFGANAKRIQRFLAQLEAEKGGG